MSRTNSNDKSLKKEACDDLMSKSLLLAEYTFLLQIILRVITFGLNGLAFRWLDASLLGLVNFRLALYYTTLVFTARESFRRACLSRGSEILLHPVENRRTEWQGLLNVMWLTVPVGVLVSCILLPVWVYLWPSPSISSIPSVQHQYIISCLVYTLSAILELATEPMWLFCQLGMFLRVRIALEAIANIARAVGIVISVCCGPTTTYGLYLLTFPQILHGLTLLLGYVLFAVWFVKKALPESDGQYGWIPLTTLYDFFPNFHQIYFDWPCISLAWSFFRQGMLKQFLTEGERYLISAFHLLSFADQGVYDLVNNIGSLAPRLLFNPVEESCHLLFSRCIQREISPKRQNPDLLRQAINMLATSLRLVTLIAWFGCTFSQAYSRLLLYLYGGSELIFATPESVVLLRTFAAYLVLLAWNGPTEAFLNAAMTMEEISKHNRRLAVFSVVFLGAAWFFVRLCGAAGFILANCVNILTRVIYSCHFIKSFFICANENRDLSHVTRAELQAFSLLPLMFPSGIQALVLGFAAIFTLASEYFLCPDFTVIQIFAHLTIGLGIFVVVFCTFLWQERVVFASISRTGIGKVFGRIYELPRS